MVCKHCNSEILDVSEFCSFCGAKCEENNENNEKDICPFCRAEIKSDSKFCSKCGCQVKYPTMKNEDKQDNENYSKPKANSSYVFSVIGAIISLILRLSLQEDTWFDFGLFKGTRGFGIDPTIKPFLTFIPAIFGIIAIYKIITDEEISREERNKKLIINGVIIALALVFIWLDIPRTLYDF